MKTEEKDNKELVKASQQVQAIQQFNFFDAAMFETMQRVCTMFASSEIVPEIYRISPKNTKEKAIANCMIAIETATRIGASPLMVMQNMNIIYGRPSWSAKFLTATVNGCGRYESIKYKFRNIGSLKGTEYTEYVWNEQAKKKLPVKKKFEEDIENWECIAYTKEKGGTEVLESIPVSLEMALKEGWYTKEGSKWKTMPKLMLQYRSVTFWTSAYAPELSMGIKTTEEVYDYEDIPYEEVKEAVKQDIKAHANKEEMKSDETGAAAETGNSSNSNNPI